DATLASCGPPAAPDLSTRPPGEPMRGSMSRPNRRPAFAALLPALLPASAAAGLPAPPVFAWVRCPSGFCEQGADASRAVANVGGDGLVGVLWGGYRLMALEGARGALEWSYPAAVSDGRLWPSPALANLDRDGSPEIVIANGSGLVVAL